MSARPTYALVIRSDNRQHPSPEINRLRMLLKSLGRAYGFDVIEARPIEAGRSASGRYVETDSAEQQQ